MTKVEVAKIVPVRGDQLRRYLWQLAATCGSFSLYLAIGSMDDDRWPFVLSWAARLFGSAAIVGAIFFASGAVSTARTARRWTRSNLVEAGMSRPQYGRVRKVLTWSSIAVLLLWLFVTPSNLEDPSLRNLLSLLSFYNGLLMLSGAIGIRMWLLPVLADNSGSDKAAGRLEATLSKAEKVLFKKIEASEQAEELQGQIRRYQEEIEQYRRLRDIEREASVLLNEMRQEFQRGRRSSLRIEVGLFLAGIFLGVIGNAYTSEIVSALKYLLPL